MSYIFCPNEIYFMKEVRAAGKKFSAFFLIQPLIFLQFCTSVSQLEKKYAFFIPIGEKICISPPFSPLFYNIFSPICYLAPFTHLKTLIFRIKGRDVHFDKCCGGVLDSSFEELCGRYNIYQYCILNWYLWYLMQVFFLLKWYPPILTSHGQKILLKEMISKKYYMKNCFCKKISLCLILTIS